MTVYAVTGALIGTAAERPAADAATNNRVVGGPLYIASDTGEIFESTGAEWVSIDQLPAGTSLPDVIADGQTPGGLVIAGQLQVAGVVAATQDGLTDTGSLTVGSSSQNFLFIDGTTGQMQCAVQDAGGPHYTIAADTAGMVSLAGGYVQFAQDGSGQVAGGEITWNVAGSIAVAAGSLPTNPGLATPSLVFAPSATTGHPTAGAHDKGEMIMDSAGNLFVCQVAGTPGTWKQVTLA